MASRKGHVNVPVSTNPMTKAELMAALDADEDSQPDVPVIIYVRNGNLGSYYQLRGTSISVGGTIDGKETRVALVLEAGALLSVG